MTKRSHLRAPLRSARAGNRLLIGPIRRAAGGVLALAAVMLVASAAFSSQAAVHADALAITGLDPDKDTYVSSARPNDAFGGEDRLWVGDRPGYGATRSLLYFDHEDLDEDQAITGAELRLTLRDAGPQGDRTRDLVIRRVTSGWSEGGTTWNNFPSFDDNRLATRGVGTSSGLKSWRSDELTELIQGWRWPEWQRRHRDNDGLYLQGYEAEGSHRGFDSDEGRDEPELRLTHVTDDFAPTAELEPLPRFIAKADPESPQQGLIDLRWTFEDPEPATGVDFLQLLSQVRDGPLEMVEDKIRRSKLTVRGRNGHRIGFAIRAVDVAGNVERREPAETTTLIDLSPPAVTVEPLPAFVTGPFTLRWGGPDEPAGQGLEASGVRTYDVFHNINDGGWGGLQIGTTETSMTVRPVDASYAYRARGIDRAENVQPVGAVQARTVADMRAPRVLFEPHTTIDERVFTVRWSVIDPGARASGPAGVDIQYRVDGGPWRDWVIDTRDRERVFEGAFSHIYEFRGRARDVAGNEGTWPDRAQLVAGVIDREILTSRIALPITYQQR